MFYSADGSTPNASVKSGSSVSGYSVISMPSTVLSEDGKKAQGSQAPSNNIRQTEWIDAKLICSVE